MANLIVETKRTNQKIHFEGVSDANPGICIPLDFAPPLGDGLSEIHFQIRIESEDITDTDMEDAMKQAEAISPVWQAVKNNITVKTTFALL